MGRTPGPAGQKDGREFRNVSGVSGCTRPGAQGAGAAEWLHRAVAACLAVEGEGERQRDIAIKLIAVFAGTT